MGKAIVIKLPPNPSFYCTKKQYATKEAAKAALRRVQSFPADGLPRPVAVYKCRKNPGCGQWHLTKQRRQGSETL